jgi:Zn-dependent protease
VPLHSVRLGRLAGIPIGIHPLWLAVVALITWALGADYFPQQVDGIAPVAAYALGLASALLLFASILLHELGHAVVARRYGVEVEEIDLWLLGGVARMSGEARRPQDELRFALAGPAVTLVIALAFGAILVALPADGLAALRAMVEYQVTINAVILVFNLLPAFPLDGGRVARSLAWLRTGDRARATSLAASLGRAFAYGLIALGALGALQGAIGGLWLVLVGLFLIAAGRGEEQQTQLRETLAGRTAGDLARRAVTVPGRISVDEAVSRYFVPYGFTAFPVTERAGVPGLISISAIEGIAAADRATTPVRDAVDRDQELFVDQGEDVAELIGRPAFQRVGRAIVVGGDSVRVVSITDVERAVRALRIQATREPAARSGIAGRGRTA